MCDPRDADLIIITEHTPIPMGCTGQIWAFEDLNPLTDPDRAYARFHLVGRTDRDPLMGGTASFYPDQVKIELVYNQLDLLRQTIGGATNLEGGYLGMGAVSPIYPHKTLEEARSALATSG
jgi:hypothetical protein